MPKTGKWSIVFSELEKRRLKRVLEDRLEVKKKVSGRNIQSETGGQWQGLKAQYGGVWGDGQV